MPITLVAMFTVCVTIVLVLTVHQNHIALAFISGALGHWSGRWQGLSTLATAKKEYDVRCKGGIPDFEEVYSLIQKKRDQDADWRFVISFDDRYQSPASIPPGTFDLRNVTFQANT